MAKLKAAGVHSCGDIVNLPTGQQKSLFGSDAQRLVNLASGIDNRPIIDTASKVYKSLGITAKQAFLLPCWQIDDIAAAMHPCRFKLRHLRFS